MRSVISLVGVALVISFGFVQASSYSQTASRKAASAEPSQAASAEPSKAVSAASQRALLDKYCVRCYSTALRTAGLDLQ